MKETKPGCQVSSSHYRKRLRFVNSLIIRVKELITSYPKDLDSFICTVEVDLNVLNIKRTLHYLQTPGIYWKVLGI